MNSTFFEVTGRPSKMRRVVAALFGALILTLPAVHAGEADESVDSRIEAILTSPESDYVEPKHCLSTLAYDTVEILDEQRLLFRGRGKDELWLNQLAGRCAGLRRDMTLQFDLHGNQACRMDTVRGVESYFYFWQSVTGPCVLGGFEPVTQEQVALIKQAIAGAH
jgi:hypothetical protein